MTKEIDNSRLKTKETSSPLLKVPSVVQIVIAQVLAVGGTTSFILAVVNTLRPGTFGEMSLKGVGNWVWFLLGLFLLGWSLWQIFRPKIKDDTGGFVWLSRYGFCSTHPSYVFLDSILLATFGFLFWYAKNNNSDSGVYRIMLIFSSIFPVLRLFAWYILGLKITAPSVKAAWKPVAWLVVPTFIALGIVGIFGLRGESRRTNEIANLPVIDEKTFTDGKEKFNQLLKENGDNSGSAKVKTGFVRLRANQLSEAPALCKNKDNIEFATVLADLGASDDVLIVASHYDNGGYDELLAKSANNRKKEVEVIGKLREMPAKSSIENWKNYCGIENLPPPKGDRYVLEMEMP